MGSAFQCDRCQSFDSGTPVLRVVIKTVDPPVQEKTYELCPKCLMGLTGWLDEKRGTDDN